MIGVPEIGVSPINFIGNLKKISLKHMRECIIRACLFKNIQWNSYPF